MAAGMHAQEWITTSSACWIVHQLLHGCGPSGTAPTTGSKPASPASWRQRTAEHFEWHVFPNVNPDGYEYSFMTVQENCQTAPPTDAGVYSTTRVLRDYPHLTHLTAGSSTTRHPCARNFPGRAPLSEPETRALADYVRALRPSLKVYISLHSSKQMILFPWGCCTEPSADHDELMEIGTRAANALERVHGTKFVVGPISTTIYMAPGNSVDWAYSIGIKYAFAMELRNPVQAERYVRASAIVDTGEETFEAIITILAEVAGRLGSGGGQPSGQPQQRAPRPQRPRAPKPSRRRKLHANGSTNVTVG
ncbi:zinc carboxypeptidase-like [Frankliniella occidentalis]|uniref:Zinc carboxypeptidase-like n=1 Tax=Frankliniella occidentalis TaxID=133901 RepID=A0A9C6X2R9_FRAOC|nr:zinc carboxypeptidase-like [Frankliniella occidentalis]